MSNCREIEKKLIVGNGLSQPEIDYLLVRLLNPTREVHGHSTDYYYKSVGTGFDFIRLRLFKDNTAEITGKKKDSGSNFNRLEINLPANATDARRFCDAAWGDAVTEITKCYSVFVPGFEPELDVSTYVIDGVDAVYLEVEGGSEEKVEKMVLALKRELVLGDEPRSLYEIHVVPRMRPSLARVLGF